MTIEEKMEHFKSVSLENASNQSVSILTAYKQSLDEQFEKHKETAIEDSKELEQSKLAAVRLDAKRNLAKTQAEVRREITLHQNKLKAELFNMVNDKITAYKNTSEYKESLVKQIKSVINEFADAEAFFYIDASDEALLEFLIKETGADIELSQTSFIGGTKAIINSKNILVDNSFKTKLSEEQEKFTISI